MVLTVFDCASEAIHAPGSIQPHGVMLLAETGTLVIRSISACALDILGVPAEMLIGRTVIELFKLENTPKLRAAAAASRSVPGEYELVSLRDSDRQFYAWIHCSENIVVIDLEPYVDESVIALQTLCKAMDKIEKWVGTEDVALILRETTQVIQEVTGFDRVFVYQFDSDWNGMVTAETCGAQIASLLGVHYPATDISEQARKLFREVLVRQLVDVDYTPSPLVGDPSLRTLDIRHSCLRSYSPLHLEYMRNMGVAASLIGSIIVEGKLWGLVICHQIGSKKPQSGLAREIFRRVCNAISVNIAACYSAQMRRKRLEREYLREAIIAHIESDAFANGRDANALLHALDADGFVLLTANRWQSIGATPSESQLRTFTATLLAHERVLATDHAAASIGSGVVHDPARCAGMLMIGLPDREQTKLFWFRRGKARVIDWGGNPNKAMTLAEGVLRPRKSYARYSQDLGIRSRAWSAEEIEFVDSLRASIAIGHSRLLKELSALQKVMAEVNAAVLIIEAEPIALPGHRIIMVTDAVERITGYTKLELIGSSPRMFQGPNTDSALYEKIRDSVLRDQPIAVELINYRKDGSPIWIELQIVPYAYQKCRVSHWMVLQTELSQARIAKLESENKKAASDATEAAAQRKSNVARQISSFSRKHADPSYGHNNLEVSKVVALRDKFHGNLGSWNIPQQRSDPDRQSKARFFAAASHDLLQPLNAARIYASVLNQQADAGELTRDIAGRIDLALVAAEDIIDVLIEVAKLDSGATKAEFEEFSLGDLLSSLVLQLSSVALLHSLDLRLRPCAWIIRSDPKLLRRVLQNLICNALRYTLKGGVLIGVRKRGAQLVIEIWDTGIGIDEKFAETILNEFTKANRGTPRGEKSLGLGLAICDRVCRLLDHDFSMLSKPNIGSCFRVTVPLVSLNTEKAADKASEISRIAGFSKNFTLLCVDDELENLRSMTVLLQSWGAEVYGAQSVDEAIALMKVQRIDVLLTDQRLGGDKDGISLISEAHKLPGKPLFGSVLITADRSDLTKQRCLQEDIHLLGKPLKAVKLRALMTHFMEKKSVSNLL